MERVPPKAILFDLDDTLIDRDLSIARFASTLREAFASELDDIAADALAQAIRTADAGGYRARREVVDELRTTLPWRTRPDTDGLLAFWQNWFPRSAVATEGLYCPVRAGVWGCPPIPPYPGGVVEDQIQECLLIVHYDVLDALRARGVPLGLVTNGAVASQQPKIEWLGLRPYIATIVISEAVNLWKPDPEIFHLALAELDVPPAHAWYVGDNPINDVRGAASAGLSAVWFRRSQPWPAEHATPDAIITAIGQLLDLLDASASGSRHETVEGDRVKPQMNTDGDEVKPPMNTDERG